MWGTIYVKLSILIEVTGTVVLALSDYKSTCMVEFSAGKAARVRAPHTRTNYNQFLIHFAKKKTYVYILKTKSIGQLIINK